MTFYRRDGLPIRMDKTRTARDAQLQVCTDARMQRSTASCLGRSVG